MYEKNTEKFTLLLTPLSVKECSNQQQENRCEESTDYSPCHISCPETGIPRLVLHCSFLNFSPMHFQSGCCSVPTVSSSGLNLRTKQGFALFTAIRFDVHKETLFSFREVVALYQKNQHRDQKPSYCRGTVHDTEGKEKEKQQEKEKRENGPMDRVKQVAAQQVLLPMKWGFHLCTIY